jgi:hypothetical protein
VQPLQLVAEDAAVHRDRLHGAPHRTAARLLGQVVGVAGHPGEPHRGLLEQEVDDLGATFEERVPPLLRDDVADDGVEVAPGLVRVIRVDLAGVAKGPVSGNPHAATGPRRGAAEVRALLDQDGVEPVVRGGERRGHPGTTGTHDDDVALLVHRTSGWG